MKKFFTVIFLVIFTIMVVSCSSRPRQPRTRSSNTGLSFQSQQAAAETAYVSSEPMKIWINPIEYQLEIATDAGKDGYIDEVWPKDSNSSEAISTYVDTYTGVNANAQLMAQGVQFRDANMTFDKISGKAQRAILSIIDEYGLDGFFVTMIDEYTDTLSQTQKSERYKTKDGEVKQNATVTTTMKSRVRIKGIALKLKYLGPVNKERADKVRQTPTSRQNNNTYNINK
ncbi:hypothetical protein J6W78_09665 [bacterium]|nr:hypothetical protein [bacterium]